MHCLLAKASYDERLGCFSWLFAFAMHVCSDLAVQPGQQHKYLSWSVRNLNNHMRVNKKNNPVGLQLY